MPRRIYNDNWTEQDIATLIQMRAEGKSRRAISEVLGFSLIAISAKVNRLCLPRISKEVRGRIISAGRQAVLREPAEVKQQAIARMEAARAKAAESRAKAGQDRMAALARCHRSGMTARDAAESLGLTVGRVRAMWRETYGVSWGYASGAVASRVLATQVHGTRKERVDISHITSHAIRCSSLPELSESEADRLVREHLERKGATQCPPRFAATVNNGAGL